MLGGKMLSLETILLTTTVLVINTCSVQGDCSRCLECNEGTNMCSHCPAGLWGFECDRGCSTDKCLNNTCEQFSGRCLYGCIDGYYPFSVSRGMSCLSCPENCKRCTKRDYCTECVPGRFGDRCQHTCDVGCDTCTEYWDGSSHGTCLTCSEGLSGHFCDYNCSFCKNGLCDRAGCTLGECMDGYHYYNDRQCVRCFTSCTTCSALSYKEQKCLTCPVGTWGDLCNKACSAECVNLTCDQDTSACMCDPGSYQDTDNSCKTCPANCRECTSDTRCTTCIDGYFGNTCHRICSPDCLSCDYGRDNCTKCVDGKFVRNSACHKCDTGCVTCKWLPHTNLSECESCEEGYRHDRMEDKLVYNCFKCPSGCTICNKNYECQACYPGYYRFLHTCCPSNCIGCKSSTDCTRCEKGLYGKTCSQRCHENCKSCSKGNTCNECVDGRYGLLMEYNKNYCECSLNECSSFDSIGVCLACKSAGWVPKHTGCCECNFCIDNSCDASGNCRNGCKSTEYHGKNCSIPCKETIDYCTNCVDESDYVRCTDCLPYTTFLTNNTCEGCSRNCKSNICGKHGNCSYGCWEGWTGPKCDMKCAERCIGNCNHTHCDACRPGFHGDYCSESCGENCLTNSDGAPVCDKAGLCLGCVQGYFEAGCNKSCSDRCNFHRCEKNTGYCSDGCVGHFYDRLCETPCNPNCFSLSCSEVNGTCLHGCVDGYKGDRCNEQKGPTSSGTSVNGYLTAVTLFILQTFQYGA